MTARTVLPLASSESTAVSDLGPPARPLRVALVNMPWARIDAPSIQCGLLKSIVRDAGHSCDVHYLNLDLAASLGPDAYDTIAEVSGERLHQLGEWVFAYAAFGDVRPEPEYLSDFPEVEELWQQNCRDQGVELVTFRRKTLPDWLHHCADRIDWGSYDVVGFTSTFTQNTASLAFGRILKDRFPRSVLVYGGANFDGEMGAEFIRHLPWLDYVVTGEGDVSFPTLLRHLADGAQPAIPGVRRQGDQQCVKPPMMTRNLDALPTPDYHDYFQRVAEHGARRVLGDTAVKLPVELSRGCWWGEKHHCTFCGLNSLGMAYRSKGEERALEELTVLLRDYPAVHVEAVDNILDMTYLSSVCTALGERRWDISVFFEVKANLTREQIAVLARAGIHRIQPGIESLSTHVLKLMRKGATQLINIRLLKWARYYGVTPQWNVLSGFPGETDEDYREQARLVPLLHHLQPPEGAQRIWLERFSPYFTDPAFSIENIRPRASYHYIYPEFIDTSKIAYYFDYDAVGIATEEARAELAGALSQWQRVWRDRRPSLEYQRLPGKLNLIDRRSEQPRRATLRGWHADAYEACGDTARSARRVREQLLAVGREATVEEVTAFLDRCCRSGVMVSEEGRYLSLALPENPGW